jgi:hypothetical protein
VQENAEELVALNLAGAISEHPVKGIVAFHEITP